jgi:hypothetical protein
LLTPERVVTHEHDLVQKLLIVGVPTGQIGICCRSDHCAASTAYTINLLPGKDLIRERASSVDLASAGQLDLTPSATGTKGDKKLGFRKESQGLEIKSKIFYIFDD